MDNQKAPLICQKSLFSLDQHVHYLNCAYMSPMLKSVEEAGIQGILEKRNPQNLDGTRFFNTLPLLRESISKLIGARSAEHIALVASASYGLSTVAKNVVCKKGQDIVLVQDEFPSNYYCWKKLSEEKGLNLIIVSPDEGVENRVESWNANLLNAIGENTALVSLEHAHWMDGSLFDLKAITDKCKRYGTYTVVDGTQSVGMLDINVEDLGLDALVCAGYKWLMGPYSMGFAYFSERLMNGTPIEENWISREGSHHFAELTDYTENYRTGAIRYDVGETSNFILVPMFLTAVNQLLDWQIPQMHNYVTSISKSFMEALRNENLLESDPKAFSPHLFSVAMPQGVDVKTFRETLIQNNVITSVRGDFLRISLNVYNTKEDLDVLQHLLFEAIKK